MSAGNTRGRGGRPVERREVREIILRLVRIGERCRERGEIKISVELQIVDARSEGDCLRDDGVTPEITQYRESVKAVAILRAVVKAEEGKSHCRVDLPQCVEARCLDVMSVC